jgi:signal transduction histidine kinase
MNGDAVWSKETILSFKVLPPFWRTWWFIGILIIAIAASLYIIYRYRLTKALELEKIRTRIATDLHDDIGATLSSISFYSEAVKQKAKEKIPEAASILDKMGETSRSMVSSMSDIVWAINPNNDGMEKMLYRMQSHAAELCGIKNVTLLVDADEKIHHLKPQLEQRKNIYLIFKEALNNALKYADCAGIWLTLKYNNNLFSMQLKDDGKGFDTNKEFMGNGLMNMQRRAAEIDGTFTVVSEVNKGTIVTLIVKIT